MAGNPAALRPAEDLAHASAGHLAFLAEPQPAGARDVRIGDDLHGEHATNAAHFVIRGDSVIAGPAVSADSEFRYAR